MFSCEVCEIFKDIFFYRTPAVAVSELMKLIQSSQHQNQNVIGDITLMPSLNIQDALPLQPASKYLLI